MFTPIEMNFNSRRSPVLGRHFMVAASQPLAAACGIKTLQAGGNAADAGVATAAALNVTEPGSTGIGGDCFVLYYEAQTGRLTALNGSGRAPQQLTLERLRKEGFDRELPPFHPHTVTVPGACAAWCGLIERHGRLNLAAILEPAIQLAEEGFPVSPVTAYFWDRAIECQSAHAPGGVELTIDGRAPRAGEIFSNPNLGRTFRRVAEGGKKVFYEGEIAEAIVATLQQAGGCMQISDLAAHTSTWDQPIGIDYRGYRVWECPPNGQGFAALLALNLLEGFEVESTDALSAERLHLLVECMRLAFADSGHYVADPAFAPFPVQEFLSKDYADQRRRLIDPRHSNLSQLPGTPGRASDTVYFCVVDGEGNACSMINSNYMGFGTGIVPSGWGFSLQNRGHAFSLDPQHANVVAPGKRPYHTIIPGMITRPKAGDTEHHLNSQEAGELVAPFGVMGGFMQPQGHLQVVVGLIDDHLDPQAALDRPRFCLDDGRPDGALLLEEGVPEKTCREMARLGHQVEIVHGQERAAFGRGQIIYRDSSNGVLWGGSDPRADGCAIGY